MVYEEFKNDRYRRTSKLAGILFLIGTLAGLLSIAPAIDSSDYLTRVFEDSDQVIIAAIFQFIMAISYIGFAIVVFSLAPQENKNLSIGFLVFRLLAGAFNILGVVIILLLVTLSKEFNDTGTLDMSHYESLGSLLKSGRDIINHVVMILLHSIGGLILYYLLYKTKIVPRWLSLCGLSSTIITILATMLLMFDVIGIITIVYIVLSLPLAFFEIVFAIWLVVKGFNACYNKKVPHE